MSDPRFAVFDFETTGLGLSHRVIEMGLVVLDQHSRVIDTWETLINPYREVGATECHGLTAGDLIDAPSWADIAGDVVARLKGSVLVAHNLPFDARFLRSEFARTGSDVEMPKSPGLCTMAMSGLYLPSSRSLVSCAQAVGHDLRNAHSAIDDANATAALLQYYIRNDGKFFDRWSEEIQLSMAIRWPDVSPKNVETLTRKILRQNGAEHFLSKLVSKAPRCELFPLANAYLEVLDRVLIDRVISKLEAREILETAASFSLSREDALSLHAKYLCQLAATALADGSLSPEEEHDLNMVALLLGLKHDDVRVALKEARTSDEIPRSSFRLDRGDAIVFTGECPGQDRMELTAQAKSLGLEVKGGVSKKIKCVVSADPDSLSGKAQKARLLGIPVLTYEAYFKALDLIFLPV